MERRDNSPLKGYKYTLLISKLAPKFKEERDLLLEYSYLGMEAANTTKAHWNSIVNYIESRINNGVLEGLDSKIQLAKNRARCYRKTKNFISMIFFICGKLKFDYPRYST